MPRCSASAKGWVPASAGTNGSTQPICGLVGGPRVLAQDVPELRLERGERFHHRGGIELPGDAGRQLVCGVIGKMSPVLLPIPHPPPPPRCPPLTARPSSHFS